MRLDQATLDAILDRKQKLRIITIPFERGRRGELLKPFREHRVYTLTGPHPYERALERARRMPVRARAVTWLFDQADGREATKIQITTLSVLKLDDAWSVSFELGDVSDSIDLPRLLAASAPAPRRCKCGKLLIDLAPDARSCPQCGRQLAPERDDDHGYTRSPSRSMRGEGEAISPEEQRRFTTQSHDRRDSAKVAAWEKHRKAISDTIEEMRGHDLTREEIKHLKGLERQRDRLDRLLVPLKTAA